MEGVEPGPCQVAELVHHHGAGGLAEGEDPGLGGGVQQELQELLRGGGDYTLPIGPQSPEHAPHMYLLQGMAAF